MGERDADSPEKDVDFLGDVDMFDEAPKESFPALGKIEGTWQFRRPAPNGVPLVLAAVALFAALSLVAYTLM